MQQFSNTTLHSNWFEDRLAVEQQYKAKPDLRIIREKEADLNCLTSSGIPKPLGCIQRLPKQNTNGLIPDDGFRELKTTTQSQLQNPTVHKVKEKPVMRMINKYNIAELSLVDRPIGGTRTGFGAVISRHPDNHDQRFFNTSNAEHFGVAAPLSTTEVVQTFQETYNKQAGGQHRPFEKQGVQLISNLTGEVYSKNFDPQEQTDVQRAWLYSEDPGVRAVNQGLGGKSQMQPFDNANSLPLGEGMWAAHQKGDTPGYYRRVRTDVTMSKNNIITRK